MKTSYLPKTLGLIFALTIPSIGIAQQHEFLDYWSRVRLSNQVRAELRHAWEGYKTYAWRHDELRPISKQPLDFYGGSLLTTPIDALDTFILAGLRREAREALELIKNTLTLDQDISVKVFEVTIRNLGGLLSGYELTGDSKLLQLAKELGDRLLPAFDSPTGMPYQFINLRTGAASSPGTNPAEIGTLTLEFGTLSRLTGNPIYYQKAKNAVVELYNRRSQIGLVGSGINVESGDWTSTDSSISGGIDSYIEYLWKTYLLFGDRDFLNMWQTTIAAVNQYLADIVRNGELWYGHVDINTGQRTSTIYGALDAFFAGLLALSGDINGAARLERSNYTMWVLHGIEPELIDYNTTPLTVVSPPYILRPEAIESTFYLHYFTHNPKYLAIGKTFFDSFVKYCRVDAGYTRLKSVITKEYDDEQDSFCLAEDFKYYYLLFSPVRVLDLNKVVINTEAHPLFRIGPPPQ